MACFSWRHRRAGNAARVRFVAVSGMFLLSTLSLSMLLPGCEKQAEIRGQLIITLQTDMAVPQQIDDVLVQVSRRGGEVLYMQRHSIGASINDQHMPGTVSLIAGQSSDPITVLVAGSKDNTWRTYREIVTTIPRDRVAELRMPIQWLCNESAQPMIASLRDGTGGVVNRVIQNCADGFTCKAGTCAPNETDSDTLPDFAPENVFGGAERPENGTCFDVVRCMATAKTVEPDAECTIAKPEGDQFNVGLRVASGGICNEDGPTTTCYVPLDGEDDEGWTYTADRARLQLPPAVCTRLAERKVLAVQTSDACQTKEARLPPCGSWSSVPDDRPVRPAPDSLAASWPSPEVLAAVPLQGSSLCCPLMSEEDMLYTCTCTPAPAPAMGDMSDANMGTDMASPERGVATVHVIDALGGAPRRSLQLDTRPNPAAAVFDQSLYWAGLHEVFKLPLEVEAVPTTFPGRGGFYPDGTLLVDANGFYLLTSGLGDNQSNTSQAVQLLRFSPTGEIASMDALGNRAVKQFAQDASAFYAVVNVDEIVESGQPFLRTSSVVRIDKQTHVTSTLLTEERLMITDLLYNGYLGVVSDGTDLFALFESQPTDGTEHLQIARVTQAGMAAPGAVEPIFDLPVSIEPRRTALRLLGAVDGAVLFTREEYDDMGGRLRSSSLLVIPSGETAARFVADFVTDAPFVGVAASADRIFWLNQSGRIFALAREALAP